MPALTGKRERFSQYKALGDKKATDAQHAINAGYAEVSAHVAACRLLKNDKIKARILELQAISFRKVAAKYEITQERILKERARIAFFNLSDIFNNDGSVKSPDEWGDDAGAVLAGVKIRTEFSADGESIPADIMDVKVINKENSLLALEKMWGMYEEHNRQKHLIDTSKMNKKELIKYARELLSNLEPKQITNQS